MSEAGLLKHVSIIIPVFNDTSRLLECLACISAQTYPAHQLEILVIDNGSTVDVGSALTLKQITLIKEKQRGSYAARNAGIAASSGEILAFTDSDCRPIPTWIEEGVSALCSHSDAGFVAGNVSLFHKKETPSGAVELFEDTIGYPFPQELFLEKKNFGVTANLFIWRSVFMEVGSFNSQLMSAGDWEWGTRAKECGYSGVYAPDVLVQHPSRNSWRDLITRSARLAGGIFDIRTTAGDLAISWFILETVKDIMLIALPVWQFHGQSRILDKWERLCFMLPFSALPYVWFHPKMARLGPKQRVLSLLALIAHHYTLAFERTRLWMGGHSRRQ